LDHRKYKDYIHFEFAIKLVLHHYPRAFG